MTAKEYLSELNEIRSEMQSLQLHIEELYAIAGGLKAITYDKDRIQVSPEKRMEKLMIELDENAGMFAKELNKYQIEYDKRKKMISKMANKTYAKILRMRYLDGRRWEEIAVSTKYTFRHVTRLHGDALQAFSEQFKDVLECP